MDQPKKSTRGFASLTPEEHKRIAMRGGANVPAGERSFSKDRELASRAGSKGGRNIDPAKRSFSTNRQLAIESGRKGGKASQAKLRKVHD